MRMTLPALISGVLGIAACVTDIRSRTIPNWIPAAALLSGLAWHGWTAGWRGAGLSLLGAAAGFLVFLVFYLLGGMGGGDVKLTAGFGALLGPAALLQAALWIALLGGLASALLVYWRHWRRRGSRASAGRDEDFIPYAPAIAAGVWITFWVRS
jgi:prepilin peptidase CpaA